MFLHANAALSRRQRERLVSEQAEAEARERAGVRDNEHRAARRAPEDPELRAIAAREGAVPGNVGPVEILRGALHATKAGGQPDWPTRVSAARALAALRPEEVEPKTEPEQPSAPSIVVYDLPPGADPVLHRAADGGAAAPLSDAEAPSEQPPASDPHWFYYEPPDEEMVSIGMWSPGDLERSRDPKAGATIRFSRTTRLRELSGKSGVSRSAGLKPAPYPVDMRQRK